jgi:hypothetical protein
MNKILKTNDDYFMFYCAGCEMHHAFNSTWTFNGDLENPTISPSLLVRWTHGEAHEKRVCHSFIRDGKIEYLSDCTHEFAGQTLELEDVDDLQ